MKYSTVVVFLSLFVGGCCSEEDRYSNDFIREIRFYNSSITTGDTISFQAYQKFGTPDTAAIVYAYYIINEGDYVRTNFPFRESEQNENQSYKINVPKTGQTYFITDLIFDNGKWYSTVGHCKREYTYLKSFNLNGIPEQLNPNGSVSINN